MQNEEKLWNVGALVINANVQHLCIIVSIDPNGVIEGWEYKKYRGTHTLYNTENNTFRRRPNDWMTNGNYELLWNPE